jgi:NADH-quinone oxidoreductase subunit C
MSHATPAFETLKADFGSAEWAHSLELDPYGMVNICTSADHLLTAVSFLKTYEKAPAQLLTDICAVHYPERSGQELEVVYHLHSLTHNLRVRLKVALSQDNPSVASLCTLYAGANWMERETFDFFGVNFQGHPDLRRILNMDQMDYHPMLKQYALEDETRDDKNDQFFGR